MEPQFFQKCHPVLINMKHSAFLDFSLVLKHKIYEFINGTTGFEYKHISY